MKDVELVKSEKGFANLKYGDTMITDFENCIESHSFWSDIEDAANRAKFYIEKSNPKINFDFNLNSMMDKMMTTPEQRKQRFIDFLQNKNPDINAELLYRLVDEEVAGMKLTGPDDDHPNPYLKTPLGSDLIKAVFASLITKYQLEQKAPQEKTEE